MKRLKDSSFGFMLCMMLALYVITDHSQGMDHHDMAQQSAGMFAEVTSSETGEEEVSALACPAAPYISRQLCGGYPSMHPHWRYRLIESATPNSGTYSWSGNNFTVQSGGTGNYITGIPTSAGSFTIYCTVTYACTSGTVTYNISLTDSTYSCESSEDDF